MTEKTELTVEQQQAALDIVAKWLGPRMGYGDGLPAPTGAEYANRAEGPMLNPAWDWPSDGPLPTILLEGGPYDWACLVSMDNAVCAEMGEIGVFMEPYAGYALCLYAE
jgi:hypothetical protein